MKKTLIIDSHKSSINSIPQNMHWQNAKILSDYLGADLIWSYPSVNDNIKTGYDIIIFVHSSQYQFVDLEWVIRNPNAKIFYITNEYNLGEPPMIYKMLKDGLRYEVIANHEPIASKVVKKYVSDWYNVNLNALIYEPRKQKINNFFNCEKTDCVYYGSFRKGRSIYFSKYLDKNAVLSTHSKNIKKFKDCNITSNVINRIDWKSNGLFDFKYSLYIEDIKTHDHYNYLANRFYKALNYNVIPVFGIETIGTIEKSGYDINEKFIINSSSDIKLINEQIPLSWHEKATQERNEVKEKIKQIIYK